MKQEVITVVKDILDLSICSNWYHKLNIFQRKPMLSTLPEPDLCRFPIPGLSSPILHFSGQNPCPHLWLLTLPQTQILFGTSFRIYSEPGHLNSPIFIFLLKTDYLIHFVVYSFIWFSVSLPLWNISLMKES